MTLKLGIEAILLVLALLCFFADMFGYSGVAGRKTTVLLRPLGLIFWTFFMLVKILWPR